MAAEIRTLFWLQWRLLISMFRSRRLAIWAQVGRIVLMLLMLVFSLPFFVFLAVGLAIAMINVSAEAAYELAIVANTGMLILWLLSPAMYNADMIERFEMTRLFVHPIRFRSLVAGSTLLSLLSFVGVWTLLVLAGEVVGLAYHNLLSLPLVLLGALPAFTILVFAGRLIEDVYDLVASDRRLRGLLVFMLSAPFILLLIGYYYLQFATNSFQNMDAVLAPLLGAAPASLESMSAQQVFDLLLVTLRPSRYLIWLPTGWASAAMALPASGRVAQGLLFLVPALLAAAAMLWAHAAITKRLMEGEALRMQSQRVRNTRWDRRLPGPAALSTLFAKDWALIKRSPTTRQVLLGTPVIAIALGFALWQMANLSEIGGPSPIGSFLRQYVPAIAMALLASSVNMGASNLTGNYFGAIDREGLATLLLAPIDRRLAWLSANLATFLLALPQAVIMLLLIAVVTGAWYVLPWGLFVTLCLHVGTAPAFNFTSIIGPYRARPDIFKNQGNMWSFLGWIVAAPPVLALCVLPYFFWRPALAITLPLVALYSFGLYVITLGPLARLLERRAHQVLEIVSGEE